MKESDTVIVATKAANNGERSPAEQLERRTVPKGKPESPHTPDAEPGFVCHTDGLVTAMGWLADPLTSCAAARPEGGAGCLSGHVRICAGAPGKPGAYRDVRQANWPSTGGVSPLW